jgi:hypothetical protein
MKYQALLLFGYCLALLGPAKRHGAEEKFNAGHSSGGSNPIHGGGANSDYGTIAGPFVQIGVVALDYRPLQPGPNAPSTFGGRRAGGPARIVASVG